MRIPVKNLTLATLLVVAPLVCLADDVTPILNVKLGLWDYTVGTQSSGMPAIPEDTLAKMPPERRAQIEAMMKNAMAPHTVRTCVTADMVKKGALMQDRPGSSCKRSIKSSSAGSLEFHMECDNGRSKTVADGRFEAIDSENFKGEITGATTTAEGRTIPSKTTITGKWIGSDCGNVK